MPIIDALESDPPPAWRDRLSGYTWKQQTIGQSDANVFKLEAHGRPLLFLKTERIGPFSELPGEAARLQWLSDCRVACPHVLALNAYARRNWLLMSALAGKDLASSPHIPAARLIVIVARTLRDLHALDTRACPFDHRLDQRIALARVRMEAGAVDETDFDDERLGRTVSDLYEKLLANRPEMEDLVVTHGDACLPNFIADRDIFSGFVDCSRLGVADRHQDLALACWSIRYNLGEKWVQPFLRCYGLPEPDPSRLAFYRLLDEFF